MSKFEKKQVHHISGEKKVIKLMVFNEYEKMSKLNEIIIRMVVYQIHGLCADAHHKELLKYIQTNDELI